MDPAFLVLCISLILQSVAAVISLHLIIIRKRFLAGTLMLVAVMIMVFRIFLSLYRSFEHSDAGPSFASASGACTLSLVLVLGFLYISRRSAPLRTL